MYIVRKFDYAITICKELWLRKGTSQAPSLHVYLVKEPDAYKRQVTVDWNINRHVMQWKPTQNVGQ